VGSEVFSIYALRGGFKNKSNEEEAEDESDEESVGGNVMHPIVRRSLGSSVLGGVPDFPFYTPGYGVPESPETAIARLRPATAKSLLREMAALKAQTDGVMAVTRYAATHSGNPDVSEICVDLGTRRTFFWGYRIKGSIRIIRESS
jgi:hypothetical protein